MKILCRSYSKRPDTLYLTLTGVILGIKIIYMFSCFCNHNTLLASPENAACFHKTTVKSSLSEECSISDTPTLLFSQTYKVYHLWILPLFAYASAPVESAAEIVKDGARLISRRAACLLTLLLECGRESRFHGRQMPKFILF